MTAPTTTVFLQGQGAASADDLNSMLRGVPSISVLQSFVGTVGMTAYLWGFVTPGDGGQGPFTWNATGTANDGVNNVQPNGVAIGCWTRLGSAGSLILNYQYVSPLTGFTINVANGVGALIIQPAGGLSSGTINLPSAPVNGQMLFVTSTQNITSVAYTSPFPASVVGAVTSVTANSPFAYIFNNNGAAGGVAWFRIG